MRDVLASVIGDLSRLLLLDGNQGAFEAASEALARAKALDPSAPGIHLYLGLSALKQGQLDQVRPHLAAFLERIRSHALQEQAVQVIALLEDVTPSAAVVDDLAYSLEAAFQRHQQEEALRAEVHALEARRLHSWPRHHHHGIRRHR